MSVYVHVPEIRIQVVGFPLKVYRRLKHYKPAWEEGLPEGTRVRYVPSRHDYAPRLDRAEINQIAQNVQDGFVHIAALPTRDFRALHIFRFDCRLIRLDVDGDLASIAPDELGKALLSVVTYEQRWCEVVRPTSWHHPLWLPPPSFEVEHDLRDYWNRCDCYATSERLTDANNLLQGVIARHKRSQHGEGVIWLDIRSRRFSVDRSLHGRTPEERAGRRRFRFAAEVPQGFHYDVVHIDRHRFSIRSVTEEHHGCLRVNVDPWGVVGLRD